jgi:CBS domain-containing protein
MTGYENSMLTVTPRPRSGILGNPEGRGNSVALYELIKKRMAIRCREEASLANAMYAMLGHCTRHVPVVDAEGDLVGALSLVDAVGAVTPDAAALWQTKVRQLWTETGFVPTNV